MIAQGFLLGVLFTLVIEVVVAAFWAEPPWR